MGWTSTNTRAEAFYAGLATDGDFLLAVFTPLILLAAGFLLGVIWLRDEHVRLTALSEEITQKSATMQRQAHGSDADVKARGETPPTGRHHQAGSCTEG